MSKMMKCGLLALLVVFFCGANFASAGVKSQKRDQKRDKTCQTYVIEQGAVIAADRNKTRDRKKDGSCQSYTVQEDEGMTLAADQKRERKRDC